MSGKRVKQLKDDLDKLDAKLIAICQMEDCDQKYVELVEVSKMIRDKKAELNYSLLVGLGDKKGKRL